MSTIKKLKLKLKSGLLSELQSDTIFGHFAWRFKDQHGDEKLLEFLANFVNGEPIFTNSDGFFEKNEDVFFPKPLKLTPPKFESKNKKERIASFIRQKEGKSRKLVTLDELNLYLSGKLDNFEESLAEKEKESKDFPEFKHDLRVSVEIDRDTFQSKEGQLFSYNPKYLKEDTFISVFVKVLDPEKWKEFDCENIFKSVFEIGYGKKKSSGYGHFDILDFEDFNGFEEPNESNGFISLSHYLPANNDRIKDAYYDINVKYGKFGEEKSNTNNPFKPAMLMLKPGSCFLTDNKRDFYGRVISNFSDSQPYAVHNSTAFSLKTKFSNG